MSLKYALIILYSHTVSSLIFEKMIVQGLKRLGRYLATNGLAVTVKTLNQC
ncbi:hypothetical protein ACZ87_01167 [Candidatus Erwinia dacicola]|uniref:Uncharacterized protein n=1 Tax=Candidatus Erwinia dacicola TaxID=252393 RepID=A0A328TT55_9GAMM|nr:hypothetical protein ACZ87_01167 [Candidatus Erwinia dacicola]